MAPREGCVLQELPDWTDRRGCKVPDGRVLGCELGKSPRPHMGGGRVSCVGETKSMDPVRMTLAASFWSGSVV